MKITNHYIDHLPADKVLENERRQVFEACYSFVTPRNPSAPIRISHDDEVASILGLSSKDLESEKYLHILSGKETMESTKPYACCYGGHQFGQWAGQLGDGRAINLFEIEHNEKLWTIQLKGSGETPYSRGADGLAVLRSSIREYLCSEAMHHLGVPTTRALSICLTGDQVMRDMLYDGHPELEKGAVVTRVSPSFVRFGSFEIFAARKDIVTLRKLADYVIENHFSSIPKGDYLEFFRQVCNRTKEMVIHWQRVGFVHGVMNTDNLSILGLTIDYGPYGWLEPYDPDWTPNTTDAQSKRYRFGYQPSICVWNLVRLANALYPLIEDAEALQEILGDFQPAFRKGYYAMMCNKLGLLKHDEDSQEIIDTLVETLPLIEVDMTIFFRNLSTIDLEHFSSADKFLVQLGHVLDAFYDPTMLVGHVKEKWVSWFEAYAQRLVQERTDKEIRIRTMNSVNPKYVLRNYMAQLAIDAANKEDYSIVEELRIMLKKPYDEQPQNQKWFAKRPDWARDKVGCSMLSCSS